MSDDVEFDTTKVKLVGFTEDGVAILSQVPVWYAEACTDRKIRKAMTRDGELYLSIETPTKHDQCWPGDVIKNSPLGGLFVRHFSQR